MKKLLFVFNPCSGKAQVKNNLFEITNLFTAAGYYVTVFPTRQPMDAYKVICETAEGFDMAVISGGDGTLDEAVKGMLTLDEKKRIPLGYIPSGTTNDFANTLGISPNIIEASHNAVEGVNFKCDICTLNGEPFHYVAAFGAFTGIAYETPQDKKNIFGYLAYLIEGMKSLGTIKSHRVRAAANGETIEEDVILAMALNTKSVAGMNSSLLDACKLDDGMFEVILIKSPQRLIELQLVITDLLQAKHDSQWYRIIQTSHMDIETDEPVKWTADGEFGGEHLAVRLDILPTAVTFIVPEKELKTISEG